MGDGLFFSFNIDFLGVGNILVGTVKIIVEIGGFALSLVDMELEHIEALISAGDIVDALHGDLLGEIAISINDAVLIVLEDLADGLTVGTDDHSGAEAHALVLQPSLGVGIAAGHLLHSVVIDRGGAADAEYLYLISCSNESNSGVEKNSLSVISSPSQSFLIVATLVLLFRPLMMLFIVD